MNYLPQLLMLAAVFLLACMSPGPDFITVSSNALVSRSRGLGVALGVSGACLVWAALAMFGFGLVLTRLAWLYEAIRWAGAAYLIYLGMKMLLNARHAYGALPVDIARSSAMSASRVGFMVGITNPKSAAFFGSLFITLLPAGGPVWVQGAAMLIVAAISLGWFSFVAVMFSAQRVRAVYATIRRPIDAATGVILIGLGIRLAAEAS